MRARERTPRPVRRYTYESGPLQALDYAFRVRTNVRRLGAYLADVLGPFAAPGGGASPAYSLVDHGRGVEDRYAVYWGDEPLTRFPTPKIALQTLMWHVNREVVAGSSGKLLFHAAGAQWGDRGVVLPAAAGSGKSTLVAGLVERGMGYLTDEAVAVDPGTLAIHPYPKAVSLDPGSWPLLPRLRPAVARSLVPYLSAQWQVPPDRIRAGAVGTTCVARLVVLPTYEAGAPPALVEKVTKRDAVFDLAENSFNFGALGSVAFDAVVRLVRTSPAYRVRYSDFRVACEEIERLAEAA